MISISGSEALLGAALLLLVELSIHLRFRPLKAQLDTIEILLRRDQGQLLVSVADHEDRLSALELRLEDHLGSGKGS